MGKVIVDVESSPATPAAGKATWFVDSTSKRLAVKNDTGFTDGYVSNFSTAAQSPAAATLTYIDGSKLVIPTGKMQVGTCFKWRLSVTKTAAGTAASTYAIVVGTTGTTADAARCSFTKPAGTAAVDEGVIDIFAICRGPVGASGVLAGEFRMTHNLATTGHLVIGGVAVNAISAAFDVTVANLIVGLTVTSGASDALTFQIVQSEAWNL